MDKKLQPFCFTWTKKYGKVKTISIVPGFDLNDALATLKRIHGQNIVIYEIG